MGTIRKLQAEIDKVLKKVQEGIEEFDEIWDKVYDTDNVNQKEKYEADLKKEIKKLQRYRDQIKTWIGSGDIKDKTELVNARKAIEREMERFKVCERETKTKAFSKEGLGQAAKMDPKEKAKIEMRDWLNNTVDTLNTQVDEFEYEMESLNANRKKSQKPPARLTHLEESVVRHKQHVGRLEQMLRLLDSDQITPEEVNEVKELLDDFLARNQDDFDDFESPDDLYDPSLIEKMDSLADTLGAALPVVVPKGKEKEKEKEKDKDKDKDKEREKERAAAAAAKAQLAAQGNIRLVDESPEEPKKAPVPPVSTRAVAANPARPQSGGTPRDSAPVTPSAPPTVAAVLQGAGATQAALPAGPSGNALLAQVLKGDVHGSAQAAASGAEEEDLRQAAPRTAAEAVQGRGQPSQWALSDSFPQLGAAAGQGAAAKKQLFPQPVAPNGALPTPGPTSYAAVGSSAPGPVQKPMGQFAQAAAASVQQTKPGAPAPAGPDRVAQQPGKESFASAVGVRAGPSYDADTLKHQQQQGFDEKASPQGVNYDVLQSIVAGFASADQRADTPYPPPAANPASSLQILTASLNRSIPHPQDAQWTNFSMRPRAPSSGIPASYPQVKLPILENPVLFEKMDSEALFFAFYHQPGTFQQYLAARELKRQSWRYHKQHGAWFQRHEEPKVTTEEYEQGTYVYFDYNIVHDDHQSGWCYRLKQDFTFKYDALEDELQA